MRKLLAMLGLVAAVALLPGLARADDDDWDEQAQEQQSQQVDPQVFQQNLSPYGQWDYDNTYGQVFYPNVAPGWRPYVYGRWAWTDYGWMWVSEEPFGWATYHYGRWWWNPWRHAWGWVPGYEWAPAWVVWRFGASAIGWAPLYVGYDDWVDDYPIYYDHWVYVPCEHFYGGPVYSYVYAPTYVRNVFYNTHPAYGYVGTTSYGPPTTYVAAHSAVPITTTPVTHAASPAGATAGHGYNGGAVAVYAPPSTTAYNPAHPAPPQYRGPGASRTPVVAPPNVGSRAPSFIAPAGHGPAHGQQPGTHGPTTGVGRVTTPPGQQPTGPSYRGPTTSPGQQPGGPGYRGPTTYPGQQPGGPGYRGPTTYPGQQPAGPGYRGPTLSPGGPSYTRPPQPGFAPPPGQQPQRRPQGPTGPQGPSSRPGTRPPSGPQPSQGWNNLPSYTPRRPPNQYAFPNQPVRTGQPYQSAYRAPSQSFGGSRGPSQSFGGYRGSSPSFGASRAPAPSGYAQQQRRRSSPAPVASAPARGAIRRR